MGGKICEFVGHGNEGGRGKRTNDHTQDDHTCMACLFLFLANVLNHDCEVCGGGGGVPAYLCGRVSEVAHHHFVNIRTSSWIIPEWHEKYPEGV